MAGIFGLLSSGISAIGRMAAGQAAQRTAELNAFNTETDKVRVKIQTLQNARDRREEYISNTATNNSMFSAMGRDISSDPSVRAFLEKQKTTLKEDTDRITYMGQAKMAKLTQEATATRVEGRARKQAATIGALTTMAAGINDYQTVK